MIRKNQPFSSIGSAAYNQICHLCMPNHPPDKSFNDIKTLMSAYQCPEPLQIAERSRFTNRVQQPQESIAKYSLAWRTLAIKCNFGAELKNRLCDCFVLVICAQSIQKALFNTKDIDYDLAYKTAVGIELSTKESATLQQSQPIIQLRSSSSKCCNQLQAERT
uniref:Retrotransposon gag domain-containing protein n=1 Tax=Strigamia maritima TaxID=126957 RepID=T1JNE0_STRMM